MDGLHSIYMSAFLHPNKAFSKLISRQDHLKAGFVFMLIPIVAYTLMYIFLTIGKGAPSVFTPWLNIPNESYYAMNRFLLAPSMILAWFAATALMQVICKGISGTGTFEQLLAAIALSISIAMWGGLIHDLPMSFLSAISVIDARQHEIDMNSPTIFRTLLWIAYSIYAVAFFILFTNSVRVVHSLSLIKGIVIGFTGFLVFQLVFLVFNR